MSETYPTLWLFLIAQFVLLLRTSFYVLSVCMWSLFLFVNSFFMCFPRVIMSFGQFPIVAAFVHVTVS